MFFRERDRDTTPDLVELLEQVQAGNIIEPQHDSPQKARLVSRGGTSRHVAGSSRAPTLDEQEAA